ncbi:MAG: hypothetical protein H6672_20740 [Anaerolineaceae bacterium]|nr:hypothetical protein [Anaerolineaceae bacterium]
MAFFAASAIFAAIAAIAAKWAVSRQFSVVSNKRIGKKRVFIISGQSSVAGGKHRWCKTTIAQNGVKKGDICSNICAKIRLENR